MTEDNICRALAMMGVHKVKRSSNDNIMCQCVLSSRHEHGDKKPSMSIKINNSGISVVFCFGCQFKGSMLGLAYEMEKNYGGNLVREIRALEYGGIYRPVFKPYEDVMHLRHRNDMAELYLGREKLKEIDVKEFEECFACVPKYMIETRGLSIDVLRAWEIGYWKKGRKGVFFPIYDFDKRFIGYTIRWIFLKEDEPKYFHMPGLKKTKFLYGENMIDVKRSNKFVVVEGPVDTLKVWAAGYNALGTLGGDFSDVQASRILKFSNKDTEVIAMGDGDKGGIKLSDSIMEKLLDRKMNVRKVVLDDGKDPGDLSPEQIRLKIEKPEGSIEEKRL